MLYREVTRMERRKSQKGLRHMTQTPSHKSHQMNKSDIAIGYTAHESKDRASQENRGGPI